MRFSTLLAVILSAAIITPSAHSDITQSGNQYTFAWADLLDVDPPMDSSFGTTWSDADEYHTTTGLPQHKAEGNGMLLQNASWFGYVSGSTRLVDHGHNPPAGAADDNLVGDAGALGSQDYTIDGSFKTHHVPIDLSMKFKPSPHTGTSTNTLGYAKIKCGNTWAKLEFEFDPGDPGSATECKLTVVEDGVTIKNKELNQLDGNGKFSWSDTLDFEEWSNYLTNGSNVTLEFDVDSDINGGTLEFSATGRLIENN